MRRDDGPGLFDQCLLLADDFRQYYLGAFNRVSLTAAPDIVDGVARADHGYTATWPARRRTRSTRRASSSRPPRCSRRRSSRSSLEPGRREVQLQRAARSRRSRARSTPGALHAGLVLHAPDADDRPPASTAAPAPQLQFQLSINTEPSYDNVIVEAHTVGPDDWTTLTDLNGGTQTDPPAECTTTGSCSSCTRSCATTSAGRTARRRHGGTWNSFTGSTRRLEPGRDRPRRPTPASRSRCRSRT